MSASSEPYLVRLAERLANGLSQMEELRRERHRSFILSCQQSDGGFGGREGESDLYYTSFAVRALGMLGGIAALIGQTVRQLKTKVVDKATSQTPRASFRFAFRG